MHVYLLTSPLAKSLTLGWKYGASLTLHMGVGAYTGSKDSLNVSLKAAIDILFICLWE